MLPRLPRALVWVLLVVLVMGEAPANQPIDDLGPARSAESFADSVGVNVHLAYHDTGYGNLGAVASLLARLGVRHVRDGALIGQDDVCRDERNLAVHGIRFTYVTAPTNTGEQLVQWASCVGPAIEAYEGPNEYDLSHPAGDGDWAGTLRAFQKRLYTDVKGNPSLAKLPVIGPSLTSAGAYRSVGDLSAYLDRGNMHNYFGGHNPGTPGYGFGGYGSIAYNLQIARDVDGSKPIFATETGYGTSASDKCVDPATQAKYVPRMFLEQFNAGVPRTFEYELIDEGGPPYDAYGLVDRSLKPKPSFLALSSLLKLVNGSPAGGKAPNVRFSLTGETSNVHHTVLTQAGTFYVVLWVEAMGFDPNSRADVRVPGQRVVLHAGAPMKAVSVYAYGADFALHGSSVAAQRNIPLVVTDSPLVVRLSPDA